MEFGFSALPDRVAFEKAGTKQLYECLAKFILAPSLYTCDEKPGFHHDLLQYSHKSSDLTKNTNPWRLFDLHRLPIEMSGSADPGSPDSIRS